MSCAQPMSDRARLTELEQAPILPLLLKYSLPSIIGMAAMSLYNLIDAYYIGLWCGAYAITGLALVFPIMNIMVAVASMTGIGTAANSSIALGKGDKALAFRILEHGLILGLIGGCTIGAIIYFNLWDILQLFGARAQSAQEAYDFMSICAVFFPISATFMNLNFVMRSTGYPLKAMWNMLITVGANIILAPIFIYYLDWGIIGASTATVISQAIGLIFVFKHFCNSKHTVHLRWRVYKLSKNIVKKIYFIGLAPCLMNVCSCIVIVFYNFLFLSYEGEMGVAAFGIVNRVMFLYVMIVMGLSQGLQPIIGFNHGIGNYARCKAALWRGMLAGSGVTTLAFVMAMLFSQHIMGLFADANDPSAQRIITIGSEGMRIIMIFTPIVGAQIIVGGFFQSIGKPLLSIFLSISRQLLYLVPLLYIMPRIWGVPGIWWAPALADILAAITCFYLLRRFMKHAYKHNIPLNSH